MGTTPVIGQPVRTAALIGAEDEAIAIATALASGFEIATAATGTSQARLDLLARSGLLGVSIPTEHGGLDASNVVLAEICAIAAETSATLAEILAAHFLALEQVRSYGTEGQQNTVFPAALAGGRLCEARPVHRGAESGAPLPLAASGVGWRLGGEALCTPCARHADWLLVPTRTDTGKSARLLLPARIDGLHYVANSCEPTATGLQPPEHVLLKDVLVDNGALLHSVAEPPRTDVPQALALLLEAAAHIGVARKRLRQAMDARAPDALAIGLASVRLSAAEAAMEQAGRAIDAAQIGIAEQHRINAYLAAAAARVAAADAVGRAGTAFAPASGTHGTGEPEAEHAPRTADMLRQAGTLRLERHRAPPEDL